MRSISFLIAGRFISLPLLPSSLRAESGSYPSLIMCSLHTFSCVSMDSPSLACSSVETLQYATAILFDMLILCYGITKRNQLSYTHFKENGFFISEVCIKIILIMLLIILFI